MEALIDALEQFRQGGDLADQLILARASRAGALPVLTFDQRFAASGGFKAWVPASRRLQGEPVPE